MLANFTLRLGLAPRFNSYAGLIIVGFFLLVALLSLVYTPYDPVETNLLAKLKPPSATHWFGTDPFGRDTLSRVMAGAAVSVSISLGSVFFALVMGATLGIISGYFGGWLDRVITMLNDAVMAFPGLLLALGLMAVIGPSRIGVVLALSLSYAPSMLRVARSSTLSIKEREFVTASVAMGNNTAWTIVRHVVPHCIAPLLVLATGLFGSALLAESALSFLGLGVPPPAPTWGGMLADSRQLMDRAIWLAIFPGLAISFALLGLNLLGDAVRDALDPRMRGMAPTQATSAGGLKPVTP